jgi:hypothetical protein
LQLGRLVQRCQGTAMVATLKKGCAASMVAGCDAVADGTCWTELTDLYDNYFAACEVRKTPLFETFIYERHHFTMTGSGQT